MAWVTYPSEGLDTPSHSIQIFSFKPASAVLWQNVWEEEAALRGPPLKPWVSYSDVGPGPSQLSFEASSSFETLWGLLTSSEGA